MTTPYTLARDHLAAFAHFSARHRNPFTVLRDLDLLDFTIERMRANIVAQLRNEGATWVEVGEALNMTESAARHHFGGVDTPRPTRHH